MRHKWSAPFFFALLVWFLPVFSGEKGSAGYSETADPVADLAAAKALAEVTGKRILLEVGGEWCVWCHRLEEFVKGNEDVRQALTDNFVIVKVNYSKGNTNEAFLSQFPEIPGYPHLFVLDAGGKMLHSQSTAPLEEEKGYNKAKLLEFSAAWGREKTVKAADNMPVQE